MFRIVCYIKAAQKDTIKDLFTSRNTVKTHQIDKQASIWLPAGKTHPMSFDKTSNHVKTRDFILNHLPLQSM